MDHTLSSKAFVYPSPRSSWFIARQGERNLYLDSDASSLSFTFHIYNMEIMMFILIELVIMDKGNNICKSCVSYMGPSPFFWNLFSRTLAEGSGAVTSCCRIICNSAGHRRGLCFFLSSHLCCLFILASTKPTRQQTLHPLASCYPWSI